MFEKESAGQAPAHTARVQRRGVRRRQAILDAAEALLAEHGYQAATLKAIGQRAGIPTASVYHYFSDRHQVEAELLRRQARELDVLIGAALDDPELRTLRAAVDAVIDPAFAYFRQHPSCAELWFPGRQEALDELVRTFDRAQAERLWRALTERNLVTADTPRLAVQLAFEVANRLFGTAFRRSPAGDGATIAETKRLVTAYLQTYAAPGLKQHA
ncbi:TetR/AcrR family transcriptional regulator [Streptomyces sp. NPDC053474]|uniref:TetR/AcrR family transcriptional regulator n=1 Tax=Streptomyces sp. NPDC053474 TaxID=3365704 RepID=UPI0037CDB7C2